MASSPPQSGDEPWAVNQMEIARRLGISQGTVHRALAGKKDVSKATSAAVLRLARELNYRRNASATALRGSRFGSIGFIARQPIDGFGRTISRILTHCTEELRRRGLNLILALPPADLPGESLPRLLTDLCVDGLIVAGRLAPAIEAAVETAGVPVAWIDNRPAGSAGSFAIDETASARLATEHLLRAGRAVTYLTEANDGGRTPHYSVTQRLEGYRAAIAAAGAAENVLRCPRDGVERALAAHLAASQRPLALLCYDHIAAQLAVTQFAAAGLAMPQDASLACCDDDWIVAMQGVTTLDYDERALADRAIAHLCDSPDPAPAALVRTLTVRRSSAG